MFDITFKNLQSPPNKRSEQKMPARKSKYPRDCDWEGCQYKLKNTQLARFHNNLHIFGRTPCTLCGKRKDFSRYEDMLRHIRDVHFKCTTCGVIFTLKTDFKAHWTSKHKNKNKNKNEIEPDNESNDMEEVIEENDDNTEEEIEVIDENDDNTEEEIEVIDEIYTFIQMIHSNNDKAIKEKDEDYNLTESNDDEDYNLIMSDDDDDIEETKDENVTTYSNDDNMEEVLEENVTTHSNDDNMEKAIEENDKDHDLMLSEDDDDIEETTYSNGLFTVNFYNN